ncbi:hypothetical protein COD42_02310 [Escherichia coli]|nr:hypothetical protein COD42_02310 [Escherichia coli]PBQ84237.1 hypothetical protein COD40_27365 [Escherichia coli]PBQ85764.1 hypothetical protein COD41_02310 [Escherichia coli]PBR78950.1 hypothetical protein COD36_05140 [Escherichia coli]PBS03826.1 hypothetical protein COD35_03430 [Escherichia coli]
MRTHRRSRNTPAFLRVLPVGYPCHGATDARKKASFCIFIHHHLVNQLKLNTFDFFHVNLDYFLLNI